METARLLEARYIRVKVQLYGSVKVYNLAELIARFPVPIIGFVRQLFDLVQRLLNVVIFNKCVTQRSGSKAAFDR